MADSAATRAPDIDPFGGAAPDISWGDLESDHDDDEARALIAKVSVDSARQSEREFSEVQPARNERAPSNGYGNHACDSSAKREVEESDEKKKYGSKKKSRSEQASTGWDALFPQQNDRLGPASKWQKKKKQGKDRTQYHCDICNVDTTGEKARDSHLRGNKHMTKKRQADLKAKNEELNRHGASIAEKQARRKDSVETDVESRFRQRGNQLNRGSDITLRVDIEVGIAEEERSSADRQARSSEVAPRGSTGKNSETPAPATPYYSYSTDPRPRYFDATMTRDQRNAQSDWTNKLIPRKDLYGVTNDSLGQKPTLRSDLERTSGEKPAPSEGSTPVATRHADHQLPTAAKTLSQTQWRHTADKPAPSTAPAVGSKSTSLSSSRDHAASKGLSKAGYAFPDGKSPFMRTGPRKKILKPIAAEKQDSEKREIEKKAMIASEKGDSSLEKDRSIPRDKDDSTFAKDAKHDGHGRNSVNSANPCIESYTTTANVVTSESLAAKSTSRHEQEPKCLPGSPNAGNLQVSEASSRVEKENREGLRTELEHDSRSVSGNRASSEEGSRNVPIDTTIKVPGHRRATQSATSIESTRDAAKPRPPDTGQERVAQRSEKTSTALSAVKSKTSSSGDNLASNAKKIGSGTKENPTLENEGSGNLPIDHKDISEKEKSNDSRMGDSPEHKSSFSRRKDDWDMKKLESGDSPAAKMSSLVRHDPLKEKGQYLTTDQDDIRESRKSSSGEREGQRESRGASAHDRESPPENREPQLYERDRSREYRKSSTYARDSLQDSKRSRGYERDGSRDQRRSSTGDRDGLREGRRSPPYDRDGSREGPRSPAYDRDNRDCSRDGRRSPQYDRDAYREGQRSPPYDREKRDSSREGRRSPPYDRDKRDKSREGRRSPPYDQDASREDRRSPTYGRDGSLDSRRSSVYDRDSSRGKRRSPSYDRDEPREFRRSPSFDRDDPRDYRRDSAYDREDRRRSQSRGSGRGSSHERGDSRTIKNPDSYDRPSSKEQRTPGIQDRRLSCPASSDGARNAIGDRERSRDDPETALNGRGKGLLTDTDASDPRNSKETVRADREKRSGEERSKFASSSGGGNRSGRTSTQNDTLPSREKSGPDRDRRASDFSKPEHDVSGRYSAQPLKLRSQAIPLRPKDGSTRDDKKRRFDSEGDNDRRTAGAAPASNPALTSRTNKGSVRYETGNGDSQRRRLLEGRDIGFKGKDVDKEHSVGGYRRGDARNDDTRWRASSVDGSLRRESQYYENAGPRSGQAAVSREHGDAGASKHSGTNPRGNTNTFNPEDYPMVSREYLNAPMSVSEWRELRHFLLTSGSDIDKLAFKLLQEITLSPLVGMSEKSLQPLSNAMMDVNKHYVTPHGIFTKLNDYPMGIQRLDPRYNSTDEADIDWADYQSSEYLALCQFLDNFQYAFNNHENPTKGNKFSRYEIPFRGSFGVKTQRKGPGVLLDGQAPPLYDDAVAADPLFEKFIQHYENFDMRKRSGTM